jgi:hypothetical protein
MKVEHFLTLIKESFLNANQKVFVLQAEDYPSLFVSRVLSFLKKQSYQVETCDISEQELHTVIASLQTHFLGMSKIYWLGNATQWDTKVRSNLFRYLEKYEGPHRILLYAPVKEWNPEKPSIATIDLSYNENSMQQLGTFYTIEAKECLAIIKSLSAQHIRLTVDRACMLLEYHKVLGSYVKEQEFAREWIPHIIAPESSLFTLSQHLFAHNHRAFFTQWSSVATEYADTFWYLFWAEQLWRAYFFVFFCKEKQYTLAKKISFKLPFSFIRTDWRSYTLRELMQAHNFLYALEYRSKNGGTFTYLELFYSKFLNHDFTIENRNI